MRSYSSQQPANSAAREKVSDFYHCVFLDVHMTEFTRHKLVPAHYYSAAGSRPIQVTQGPSHLDGVNQVLDQEQAPQINDGLVEFGQNHVAVLVDHVLRQRHLLVQVLPERESRGDDVRVIN